MEQSQPRPDEGPARLAQLRAFYALDEEILLGELPAGCARVVAERADGTQHSGDLAGAGRISGLAAGTYSVQALDAAGELLAEEFITIARHPGERPVHGFATSFGDEDIDETLSWLSAVRSTVVQIYDWMEKYSAPLGPTTGWRDPSHRPVSFGALRALSAGIRAQGGVAHAYAPVYAVDLDFAAEHPELLMYRSDGEVERLFDQIKLANPANAEWQKHFAETYGLAAQRIGFNGFHLDTYGFPRAARDAAGQEINMRAAYGTFLDSVRAALPDALLSFNQVNGVPPALDAVSEPSFRYCEIWPPNDAWRHIEAFAERTAGVAGHGPAARAGALRGSLACYPPVWGSDANSSQDRAASLRTVVLTEAVATSLAISPLLYGDRTGVLCDAYYPKHARLLPQEASEALAWHRFALRCRDLFWDGEDTSWYEIGDENGAVAVEWAGGSVRPEPLPGCLMARVAHGDGYVALSVVDVSGSEHASWREPCRPGRGGSVRARILLADPAQWIAAAAVLGHAGGRFMPLETTVVEHREGLALEAELPLGSGWAVLRLSRR